MKVSIVFVNYNDWHYLKPCLESIQAQKYNFTFEIIVVDNGSDNNEAQKIRQNFPHVNLIDLGENLGFAGGNNIGMEKATGEYVFLLNADTIFLDDKINQAVEYMDEHQEVGILGPKLLNEDHSWQKSIEKTNTLGGKLFSYFLTSLFINRIRSKKQFSKEKLQYVGFILGAAMLVRKKLINQIGVLDTRFFFSAEERDWCLRSLKAGWKLVYFPYWSIVHFGGGAKGTLWYLYQWHDNSIKLFAKYWGWKGSVLSKGVFLIYTGMNILKGIIKSIFTLKKDKYLHENLLLLKWHLGVLKGKDIGR